MEYLYIRSNEDLKDKYKFGYVGSQENGLKNRLKSSITELSYYSKYVKVYGIIKKDYKGPKEFDKIFSRKCIRGYKLLDELDEYIVKNRPYSEFIYKNIKNISISSERGDKRKDKDVLDLIEEIVDKVFPLIGLICIKKFTDIELREIEKLTYEDYEKENININININIRDYQLEIINFLENKLKQDNKVYLELATGGGKSFIVFNLINLINCDFIIIFSPRKIINKQNTSSKYLDIINEETNILNNNIEDFLKYTGKKIICSCVQSSKKIEDLIKKYNLNNLFIWFDEAHHTVENWENNFFLLDNKYIKYRIFTSASPNKKLIKEKIDIFGEHYRPIEIKKLIDERWLCNLECRIIVFKNQKNIKLSLWNIKNFEKLNKKHGFSFHSRVESAEKLFKEHYDLYKNKITSIKPYLLVGESKIKDIKLEYNYIDVKSFESNSNSIAYVVKKYDMGYDFKNLDYIIFSDSKTSEKDIIQCIGRGLRSDGEDIDGKNLNKLLSIMLPTFEEENNYNNIIEVLRYIIYDLKVEFNLIKNYVIVNNDNNGINDKDYDGEENDKSKILDLLYENNFIKKINTKNLISLCIINKIHNEIEYNLYRKKYPYLGLKENIYDYKNFKWKKVLDSEGKIYYNSLEECIKIKNKIKNDKRKELNDIEFNNFNKLLDIEGYLELNKYDIRLPPFNDLKLYY